MKCIAFNDPTLVTPQPRQCLQDLAYTFFSASDRRQAWTWLCATQSKMLPTQSPLHQAQYFHTEYSSQGGMVPAVQLPNAPKEG
jgi:hypothetical protein